MYIYISSSTVPRHFHFQLASDMLLTATYFFEWSFIFLQHPSEKQPSLLGNGHSQWLTDVLSCASQGTKQLLVSSSP